MSVECGNQLQSSVTEEDSYQRDTDTRSDNSTWFKLMSEFDDWNQVTLPLDTEHNGVNVR